MRFCIKIIRKQLFAVGVKCIFIQGLVHGIEVALGWSLHKDDNISLLVNTVLPGFSGYLRKKVMKP